MASEGTTGQDQAVGEQTQQDSLEQQPSGTDGTTSNDAILQSLDTTTQQIRLLKVIGGASSKVDGIIETFELDQAPKYWALSYMWDHESTWSRMSLNAGDFMIRQSLLQFVLLFRDRHADQYVWIDQICINQANGEEKSHQVTMMAQIYTMAWEVIIWIPCPTRNNVKVQSVVNFFKSADKSDQSYDAHEDDLRPFEHDPYWERTWIVQEILLASSLQIYWADYIISWDEYCNYAKTSCYVHAQFFADNSWASRHASDAVPIDVASMVLHMSETTCADPRDKWYAVQGLVGAKHRTVVDYSGTVWDVFADAAIAIMREHQDWSLLEVVLQLACSMDLLSKTVIQYDWLTRKSAKDHRSQRYTTWFEPTVLSSVQQGLKQGDLDLAVIILKGFRKIISGLEMATEQMDMEPHFLSLYQECVDYARLSS